jgi:hypothetical protein
MIRAMEWDDPKARYPNIWHEGMPRALLVFTRVAQRLRLGDLIAVYYPASQRHAARSERYLGLSRVAGLRHAEREGYCWVDLQTAHRFQRPPEIREAPRRVFLCCDPGWPEPDVVLFRKVLDAAVAAGWSPEPEDAESVASAETSRAHAAKSEAPPPRAPEVDEAQAAIGESAPSDSQSEASESRVIASSVPEVPEPEPGKFSRLFAGVDYGGDMRDPREGTWLALIGLEDERLAVFRLRATGRHGLESYLRDPDSTLMDVEAIGLDFPFAVPTPFAESLLGGPFPEEGWWGLVKRLERLSRPDFLSAAQDFTQREGLLKRYTDEAAGSPSPLSRETPDLCPMTFHGVRMIGEDRSRYAVRPFETAQAKLLLEVHPDVVLQRLGLDLTTATGRKCGALNAVIAARSCAMAVLTGEVDLPPEELAPEHADRVRREGWIYGLRETKAPPEEAPPDT